MLDVCDADALLPPSWGFGHGGLWDLSLAQEGLFLGLEQFSLEAADEAVLLHQEEEDVSAGNLLVG